MAACTRLQKNIPPVTTATLADDSTLVRDLGCEPDAVSNPIQPKADRGLGERMVLTPALIHPDLDRAWLAETCKSLSKKVNVVVLSPENLVAWRR